MALDLNTVLTTFSKSIGFGFVLDFNFFDMVDWIWVFFKPSRWMLIHSLYKWPYEFICPLDLLAEPLNMIPTAL